MLLPSFIISTTLVLLATAATIEDYVTRTIEQNYSTSMLADSYRNTTDDSNITTTEDIPMCKDDEWQCGDGNCVNLEQKCDGAFHCEDGSDETLTNCKGFERPMLGLILHCLADRMLNMQDDVCPDICNVQPEYCAYALLAENGSPGACALPDFLQNGTYKLTNLNRISHYGLSDFSLDYVCDYGTELVGEPSPECVNGTWASTFPYCSDTCNMTARPKSYTYRCIRGDKDYECGDFVAIGTEVLVERQEDKKLANISVVAQTMCTSKRVLNVSSDCVTDVESKQDTFEKSTMNKMSEFEDKFKSTKQPSFAFEELVRDYRNFEAYVTGNTTELSRQIGVCEINLDLMLMTSTTSSQE